MPHTAGMVRLDLENPLTARHVRRLATTDAVGLLALRHALARRLPGFWGDDPRTPASVLFVRDGDGVVEAFGLGPPDPAVDWLIGRRTPFALAVRAPWRQAVNHRLPDCQMHRVLTCVHDPAWDVPTDSRTTVRLLNARDEAAFVASAPPWALRGWGTFDALIADGAACGVAHGDGFASLAWVFDQTDRYDALAVFTAPRFRRLGLARASAGALCEHVQHSRHKVALWTASTENSASLVLSALLGFIPRAAETVVHWPGPNPAGVAEPAQPSDMM